MHAVLLSAQRARNDEVNQWLDDNPLVLGLIMLAIGLALMFFGLKGLVDGTTSGKYGIRYSGKFGKFLSLFRAVAGLLLVGYSFYVFLDA